MIDPREMSVVVQGPIAGGPGAVDEERLTHRCLESVRRHLPGAEIILSTWEGADVSGLSFDRLVLSADPGAWNWCRDGEQSPLGKKHNNVNRQIVSTLAGLRVASRPYAVKLRSDMLLLGAGFVSYFRKYEARSPVWRILRERVVASTMYARNPHRSLPHPFHPSDWFFFGRREDLLDLWDIPLAPEPETSRWFDTHPLPPHDHEPHFVYRYNIEQYVWLSFLRKHGEVRFRHRSDLADDAIAVSELTLANNLVFVEPEELQIQFVKYRLPRMPWALAYTHGEWLDLYRRHCDPRVPRRIDLEAWRRRTYHALLRPVYTNRLQAITGRWKTLSPRTFRAARALFATLVNPTIRNREPS